MDKTKPNGAFTEGFAKRKKWKLNTGLAEGLSQIIPSTFVDVGAGIGRYVEYLLERGIAGYGIDGIERIGEMSVGRVVEGDVSVPLNPHLAYPSMHTAFSFEVGEHVPPERSDNFIDNLCRLGKSQVIISWAIPGQRGESHINCRDPEWVCRQFLDRKWKPLPDHTKLLRERAGRGWETKLWVFSSGSDD